MNTREHVKLAAVAAVLVSLAAVPLSDLNAAEEQGLTIFKLLDRHLQAWGAAINAPQRFVVLKEFRGEAVLDRETQLVWQRRATSLPHNTFQLAVRHCYTVTDGGRMGWRLPAAEELTSLLVAAPTFNNVLRARLPNAHPFMDILPTRYWSISEGSFNGAPGRHTVALNEVEVSTVALETNLNLLLPVLCVRGPGGGHGTRSP